MATAIEDNDTDGQLGKSIWRLLSIRCTNMYLDINRINPGNYIRKSVCFTVV